jgi:hypothetical protein
MAVARFGGIGFCRRRVRFSDSDILRHVGSRASEAGRVADDRGKMEDMKARKRQLAESLFDADGAPTLAMTEADIDLLFS